jgi:hypothetical protein
MSTIIKTSETFVAAESIEYAGGSVVSKMIVKKRQVILPYLPLIKVRD